MGAYEKFAQVYDLFMDNIDTKNGQTILQIILRNMESRMVWYWNLAAAPER